MILEMYSMYFDSLNFIVSKYTYITRLITDYDLNRVSEGPVATIVTSQDR
jgi:hypothetical protein